MLGVYFVSLCISQQLSNKSDIVYFNVMMRLLFYWYSCPTLISINRANEEVLIEEKPFFSAT